MEKPTKNIIIGKSIVAMNAEPTQEKKKEESTTANTTTKTEKEETKP